MQTLAQKPLATRETTLASPGRLRPADIPEVSSFLHLQRTMGNQAVQRLLNAGVDEDRRPAADAAGIRSVETRHRHTLLAAIRRVGPAVQRDSTGADDRDSVIVADAPEARAHAVSRSSPAPATEERRPVRFSRLPGIDVPAQSDAIVTTLTYNPDVNTIPAPAVPTEFGKTNSRIEVNQSSATPNNGRFDVELVIDNVIRYWVAGGTRTNIASDSDAHITQANYPTVVSNLTPAAAPVNAGGSTLLKNQPPRLLYWAEDLTIKHEQFHAADNEKFGREGILDARDWLDQQTAQTLDQVGVLVGRAGQMVANRIQAAMQPPAVEQRAYDDGAPAYFARVQAIKAKGLAGGYVPQPPVTPAPAPAPPAAGKAPG